MRSKAASSASSHTITVMTRRPATTPALLAIAALAAAMLDGCGSQTKTESVVAQAPSASQTTPGTTAGTTASTATTPAPTPAPANTTTAGAAAPNATRTAPEPAFTQGQSHVEGVSAAAAVLRERGYTPNDTSQYHPDQTLRVLVGTRTGSGDGYGQQAFFFVDGRYIGTDTKQPSATVRVVSQSDTEVAIAYPLYRANDPLADPSGGRAVVHFQLNNGKLTPLNPIPPANSASGLSRN
jgi:hypothetical protein